MGNNKYIGERYCPKLYTDLLGSSEWNNLVAFESLIIVTHNGDSYTSRQRVPIGIDILNKAFWVRTANYNAQLEIYRNNVDDYHQFVVDEIGAINVGFDEFKTESTNDIENFKTESTNDITTFKNTVNSQLTKISMQKTSMELGAIGDNVVDDSVIINGYLQEDSDRHLFLNQGKHKVDNTILINQPNTIIEGNGFARGWVSDRLRKSTLSATHIGDILKINIPSSENGVYLKNISLDGNNIANNGIVVGDYEFQGELIENVHIYNVVDVALLLEGDNYSTYYDRISSVNAKTCISIRKGNTHNILFKGCHMYAHGTLVDILTQIDVASNTSKNIIFDSCDFSHIDDSLIPQILIKTGKVSNLIFKNCYFESGQSQLKEYCIELGAIGCQSSYVKFQDCYFGINNFNYFCKLTNALFPTFDNCMFDNAPLKAWFKASTDVSDTVTQFIQGAILNMAFPSGKPLIGTDADKTPLQEEKAFFMVNNKSGFYNPHQRGGFKVSNNPTDNYIFQGYDKDQTAFPYPYVAIKKDSILFGNGLVNALKGFFIDVNGKMVCNEFKTGVNYLSAQQIGNVWLWCNASDRLMFKRGSAPTTDVDGVLMIPQSGASSARPTTGITTGTIYFDNNLNKPIWWNGLNWVDSVGTTV